MFEKLAEIEKRFSEVESRLADPAVASDPNKLRELGKEHAELSLVVGLYRDYRHASDDLTAAREMASGATGDDASFLREEIVALEERLKKLEFQLKEALIPKDPLDEKNVIVEIRSAAGGDEAALFAGVLFEMYQRYAEAHRFKTEVLSGSASDVGGYKEVVFGVKGKGAYSRLKHESGVHRVQRVPATESQGRIHTSTATVAVLPEAEDVDIDINPNDLKIDVYRSSGPGGQSVNTTDSAVRITHVPTGEVVACQEERSQLQNRERAMRILRARLLQRAQEEQRSKIDLERRTQVGTGERSEKIRTYNFPQNRVTDHRIGLTLHKLPQVLAGDLDDMIDALRREEQAGHLRSGADDD
ncbi:MAG: peptide chain release factor 1 [Actinobacteria bacterium]|nr:peptide chain release factor 1 [Actinomycetota bacterium]